MGIKAADDSGAASLSAPSHRALSSLISVIPLKTTFFQPLVVFLGSPCPPSLSGVLYEGGGGC